MVIISKDLLPVFIQNLCSSVIGWILKSYHRALLTIRLLRPNHISRALLTNKPGLSKYIFIEITQRLCVRPSNRIAARRERTNLFDRKKYRPIHPANGVGKQVIGRGWRAKVPEITCKISIRDKFPIDPGWAYWERPRNERRERIGRRSVRDATRVPSDSKNCNFRPSLLGWIPKFSHYISWI